ncbi:deoxyguanosinetriphosphate triphosphohydrolase family protein [Desulfitobacterium chlororespirans]|uniref:dGTPase n=1 Tax=Desulfitobacterium chlororespirans DSM 11544 TaxID=1121395 RepID=A0A1M7UYF6_9FIRM|nr:dNTP triphosphohydrolase [Desulfitobacterium chlororespirans]SHN87994.1 dGTPase [Desulfitobacterium chlororespirans DSM 11544]
MTTYREQQENWEEQFLSPNAKKSKYAGRWQKEEPDAYRTNYQRDIGRILYSDAFRRLRLKTQVFSATGLNQHNRTRLTHSLEVAQIAKSIARPLNLNTDLTEAIALGHDLGHTPFGHAGEDALQKCLEGITTFNHNAQSVWILQKTLCHRKNLQGKPYPGFNLTYDVVEGVWKHTSYQKTVGEFKELENLNPEQPASLEGQVVDISDGIAYLMHDIDDGIRNKLLRLEELKDVWLKNTDLPFNDNWGHVFIYDSISYNQNKDEIQFSPHVSELYEVIKALALEKIIKSSAVKEADQYGKDIVSTIYEYCLHHPEYVLNKFERRNRYISDKYGIERVIVDYIQWLGDETAEAVYNKIINGKSPEFEPHKQIYEEEVAIL